ncbi:trypsin-like cysteine/serine peptidase domain-containing protein [Xylariaceae sp. AK1471]|nr:trypsin-like cysteine/serine peptidase domain-containing protein [Xylariaceae sp. AK1471]
MICSTGLGITNEERNMFFEFVRSLPAANDGLTRVDNGLPSNDYSLCQPISSEDFQLSPSVSWEEGDIVDEKWPTLSIKQLPKLGSSQNDPTSVVEIVAWHPEIEYFPLRREAILTSEPREVVDSSDVMPGAKFSGIFKIVSIFQGPNNRRFRAQGTAFAISDFDALTSAHNMWHPKLGPAIRVELFMDQRIDTDSTEARKCIAVAVHAKWIISRSAVNDFSIVTVEKPFGGEVRIHPYKTTPETLKPIKGFALGFPYDFPETARGKFLCMSRGLVSYYDGKASSMVEHKVNTESGNSGGPVFISGGFVIGVHSGCNMSRGRPALSSSVSTDEQVPSSEPSRHRSHMRTTNRADGNKGIREGRSNHRRQKSDSGLLGGIIANDTSYAINQAVPLNHSGNNVHSFVAVQDFMRTVPSQPREGVKYLGKVEQNDPKTMLYYFS